VLTSGCEAEYSGSKSAFRQRRICQPKDYAMNDNVEIDQVEEEIQAYEISDEALESAAGTEAGPLGGGAGRSYCNNNTLQHTC
jgi:hypothetical protein